MGRVLVIAEKPSVAADVANALGGSFSRVDRNVYESDSWIVTSARGHLVGINFAQADDRGWGIECLPVLPSSGFSLSAVDASASALLKQLAALSRRSDVVEVVNCCDAGREGELIFGLIAQCLGFRKPCTRMWLQSMTADAIRSAYRARRPSAERAGLMDAALSRSEADLVIGANGTRALTSLFRVKTGDHKATISAGRVQTPTLAMIVDREQEIRAFVPRQYWEVHGRFGAASGEYKGRFLRSPAESGEGDAAEDRYRYWRKDEAEAIVAMCLAATVRRVEDTSSESLSQAPTLFDLTTLQREANKKFGFTAAQTLKIAQSLYEQHKVLSYPRTDACALPEDYVSTANQMMQTLGKSSRFSGFADQVLSGGWVKPNKRIFNDEKISDHFAIIPIAVPSEGALDQQESLIYDLVVKRFLAAFFPPAKWQKTTRLTHLDAGVFRTDGRVLMEPGWLAVYGQVDDDAEGRPDGATMCVLAPGEIPLVKEVHAHSGKTTPPSRYTEATLLAAMETAGRAIDEGDARDAMKERGLGTPATRASIIEGLVSSARQYVERHKKELVPTERGCSVIETLRSIGLQGLASPVLTGDWEHRLKLMEGRGYERKRFMQEVAQMATELVETIRGNVQASAPQAVEASYSSVACPRCNGRLKSLSRFLECESCKLTVWREVAGKHLSEDVLEALLRDRQLPSMDGFVSSKTKRKFSAGLKLTADFKVEFVFEPRPTPEVGHGGSEDVRTCRECGSRMTIRSGRMGKFYGCTAYPRCKNTEAA